MITSEDIFRQASLLTRQQLVAEFGMWLAERKEGSAMIDLYVMDYFVVEVVEDLVTREIGEIRIADLWKAIPQYGLKLKVKQREKQTG